jgi:hypothetical protein
MKLLDWALIVASVVAISYLVFDFLRNQRTKATEVQSHAIDESRRLLLGLPDISELQILWSNILTNAKIEGQIDTFDLILALCHAGSGFAESLRIAVDPIVKGVNTVSEDIDDHIYKTSDLVLGAPDIHRELIAKMSLVEPAVWQQSLIANKGRWGYRTVSLSRLARNLTPISKYPEVNRAISVNLGRAELIVTNGKSISALKRIQLEYFEPGINVKSKLRQQKYAMHLKSKLIGEGVRPVSDPDLEIKPW